MCLHRFCERCQAQVDVPVHRYLLSLQVQDHTGQEWLNAFGEAGDIIMVSGLSRDCQQSTAR